MIVDEDSWHFCLLKNFYGTAGAVRVSCNNSCDYIKILIKTCILIGVILGIFAVSLYLVANMIAWWVAMITTGSIIEPIAESLAATIICIGCFLGWAFASTCQLISDIKSKNRRLQESEGIFYQAYRNWKDKVCTKIEFKKSKNEQMV